MAEVPGIECLSSVTEVLAYRAWRQPDAIAFIHLLDGEREEASISYAELWKRSQRLAAALQIFEPREKRVLMLFETGIDYIVSLFGLLLAGAVAIPAFPPVGTRGLERLALICADAHPQLVLTSSRFMRSRERVNALLQGDLSVPQWVDPEQLAEADSSWRGQALAHGQLALLQYTSGSTSAPKGVMLTHDNLYSNCRSASQWMGPARSRVGCSWLPPYHDMGLMGGILQPIFDAFPTVLISPGHFVQRPLRWLDAVSRYGADVTIAPNFAFDLCVENITDEELAELDLSKLKAIYCGAEPVRQSTLARFSERFAAAGFNPAALGPCYGLAEATVLVSGKRHDEPAFNTQVDRDQLASGTLAIVDAEDARALPLVSSGRVAPGLRVAIVDPVSLQPVADGQIGEIWVQGDNVGAGYWGKEALSQQVFRASLPGIHGRFMRTGDLGALHRDELFVTGRLKDLIIIAGRNLYPQDLELAVESADPRIRSNGCVAVGIDNGQQEQLAIVAEVKRSEKLDEAQQEQLRQVITSALVSQFGVAPARIHLAPMGGIPLTTSGKVQRQATRKALLNDTLARYGASRAAAAPTLKTATDALS
ncbi:AMP-binding protein [Pseudomonas protegens]|uniref:fatty acyl-AMP ligase n=1 Tax=Pseudomonas TaxID=286 RepID=UPI000806F4E6|nr:fatty acyl-AMP ligase [Pseudomonas protegens]OBZ22403.1 AMP-binding protein [Pseudomonas protegens]OBZ26725.1 AMP-binding protein [Pseudomonas protegens]OKK39361.1 AMP-binding protein [Pseudomonas protegens]OKK43293.1 AMP-binding protein [Pseudomonas protegens]OKK55317.1 AMP-binding protein [Pseudomonas protegens]